MDNQYTLLLVEDDSFLIEILVKKFKAANFRVVHAGEGKEALRKAHDEDPDIIMLDIILPGMNGFEILEKLKSDESVSDIPVAFLSNLGQKEDVEKGKELGAVDFIVKANHSLDEIVKRTGELIAEHGTK
ncbi:MAG: response regulator [Candidatus Paceibacterota bacterium]